MNYLCSSITVCMVSVQLFAFQVSQYSSSKNSQLSFAAARGNLEELMSALQDGADPNTEVYYQRDCYIQYGYPLHKAISGNNFECAQALVEAEANVNARARTVGNTTPLHGACRTGDEFTKLLLDANAQPNVTNERGGTPLHIAAYHGKTVSMSLLLDAGANIDATCHNGCQPIHFAASGLCTPEGLLILLDAGAQINEKIEDGNTPLHLAAQQGHYKLIPTLLEYGADITLTDDDGNTPLHCVLEKLKPYALTYYQPHVQTALLLLKAGSNVTVKNNYGKTPFSLLVINPLWRYQLLDALLEHPSQSVMPPSKAIEESRARLKTFLQK